MQVIGLDIGGTKISGIVWNGAKILRQKTVMTPKTLPEFQLFLRQILMDLGAPDKVSGVGVGMAGLVNPQKGVIKYSPNIKFIKNFPLAKFLKQLGYRKVIINNDARCFTLAEARLGAGKSKPVVAGLTLGTGIGGGLVFNGKLYHGSHFGAGEAGHMIFSGDKSFEQIFQKARDRKDNKILAVAIGALLANIYRLYDPDTVVIGGGVIKDKTRNFLLSAQKICAQSLAGYGIKPQIKISELKNAGAIGAALLVS